MKKKGRVRLSVGMLTVLIMIIVTAAGCSNDVAKDEVVTTGSITGHITDIDGNDIQGAKIYVGELSASSNDDGWYTLDNIEPTDRLVVLVEREDYVPSIKLAEIEVGVDLTLDVTLIKQNAELIKSTTKDEIIEDNGGYIKIPADSLNYYDGSPFSGDYKCSLTIMGPTDSKGVSLYPGEFKGYLIGSSDPVPLISYGYFNLTLYSKTDGKKLQLKSTNPAEIAIPIIDELQSSAPAKIAFWSFDEDEAVWKQIGQLTNNNDGKYIGNVTHFSFFGAAENYTPSYAHGIVLDCDGNPLEGAKVVIAGSGNLNDSWQTTLRSTPSTGEFNLEVYPESSAQLLVYDNGVLSTIPEELETFTTLSQGNTFEFDQEIHACTTFVKVTFTLKWGNNPRDLDLLVSIPSIDEEDTDPILLSYITPETGGAELIGDSRNGNGEETVFIRTLRPGTYRFSAHHYAGSSNISIGGVSASVSIEKEVSLSGDIEGETFTPVTGGTGLNDIWNICEITVSNGIVSGIKELNYISKDKTSIYPD